jgi:hypothetical protein
VAGHVKEVVMLRSSPIKKAFDLKPIKIEMHILLLNWNVEKLPNIHRALEAGFRIYGHDFCGLGVREVMVERGMGREGKVVAYGEGATIEEALISADEDFGTQKTVERKGYVRTIRLAPKEVLSMSYLDRLVVYGRGFSCWREDDQIIVRLIRGISDEDRPSKRVIRRSLKLGGPVRWKSAAGIIRELEALSLEEWGQQVVHVPKKYNGELPEGIRLGRGDTFFEALEAACFAKTTFRPYER